MSPSCRYFRRHAAFPSPLVTVCGHPWGCSLVFQEGEEVDNNWAEQVSGSWGLAGSSWVSVAGTGLPGICLLLPFPGPAVSPPWPLQKVRPPLCLSPKDDSLHPHCSVLCVGNASRTVHRRNLDCSDLTSGRPQ